MEEDAGPLTSQKFDVKTSFLDEIFKEEFTNVLLAAKCIYEEQNLLANQPPQKISFVSLAMVDEISKATINVLNKGYISTEWKN